MPSTMQPGQPIRFVGAASAGLAVATLPLASLEINTEMVRIRAPFGTDTILRVEGGWVEHTWDLYHGHAVRLVGGLQHPQGIWFSGSYSRIAECLAANGWSVREKA